MGPVCAMRLSVRVMSLTEIDLYLKRFLINQLSVNVKWWLTQLLPLLLRKGSYYHKIIVYGIVK